MKKLKIALYVALVLTCYSCSSTDKKTSSTNDTAKYKWSNGPASDSIAI